jgi:hypothetical protein
LVGNGLILCSGPVTIAFCIEVAEPVDFLGVTLALDLFYMVAFLVALRLYNVSQLTYNDAKRARTLTLSAAASTASMFV